MEQSSGRLGGAEALAAAREIQVCGISSYPRLMQLRDGSLLCGIDGLCYRSTDQGETWSEASDYRRNHLVKGTDGKMYALDCANSAFWELEDGTVLVAYRATGYLNEQKSKFCTKIQQSRRMLQ